MWQKASRKPRKCLKTVCWLPPRSGAVKASLTLSGLQVREPHQFQDWVQADVVTCLFCLTKGDYFLANDEGDRAPEERKETLHFPSLGAEAAKHPVCMTPLDTEDRAQHSS